MKSTSLLYSNEYFINDKVKIIIPTVGDVLDNEKLYYSIVSILTSMPIDYMVQLDDAGIDFTTINEYDLFLIFFDILKEMDTSLIFGDLNLRNFILDENKQNGQPLLKDVKNNIVIDRAIHNNIASILRKIHHLEVNRKKPANDEAKKFMLKRARDKMRRKRNTTEDSQLESIIVSMVNTEQFKYNFLDTRNLTIYQFNESVSQVINKINYNNRMLGVYGGTIDPKGLKQQDFSWLAHK